MGRADVVAFAASAKSEAEARFIATSVNMLAATHAATPLATIGAHGTVIGRTRDGGGGVPAPVDYVAWTQGVATFAARVDLKAPVRGIWTPGRFSPRAKKELAARGWTIHEIAPIAPPAVTLPTTSR